MPTSNDAKDQLKSLQKVLKLGYEIAKKERSDQDQVLSQQLLKAQWKLSQERDTLMLTHPLDLDLESEMMLGNEGSHLDQQHQHDHLQQQSQQQEQQLQQQPTPRLNLLTKQPVGGHDTTTGLGLELGASEAMDQDPLMQSVPQSHTTANTTTTATTANVSTAVGRRSHRVNIGTAIDLDLLLYPHLSHSLRYLHRCFDSPSSTSSFTPTGTSKPISTATATGQGLGPEPVSPFRRARPRLHEDNNSNSNSNNSSITALMRTSNGSGGSLGGSQGRSAPSPVYLDDLQPVSDRMVEPLLTINHNHTLKHYCNILTLSSLNNPNSD